jgi:hypothetical protein
MICTKLHGPLSNDVDPCFRVAFRSYVVRHPQADNVEGIVLRQQVREGLLSVVVKYPPIMDGFPFALLK